MSEISNAQTWSKQKRAGYLGKLDRIMALRNRDPVSRHKVVPPNAVNRSGETSPHRSAPKGATDALHAGVGSRACSLEMARTGTLVANLLAVGLLGTVAREMTILAAVVATRTVDTVT